MIFAAGLGTRLHPITLCKPKAMVEVGGIPMLERVILKLKESDINYIVINTFHFVEQIEEFIIANNSFGIDIRISDERPTLLDTGGGIAHARKYLEGSEPILVHNADILTDFNISSMVRFHEDHNADATLLVSPRKSSRYLLFDREMQMKGWTNTATGEVKPCGLDVTELSPFAFGGVHIISPRLLPLLADYGKEVFSIVPFYIDKCSQLTIKAYQPTSAYNWIDIGRPESLAKAQELMKTN